MQENRQYERYLSEGKVFIKLKDNLTRSIPAELVDISLKGIGIYVQEKLAVGKEVNFVILHRYWDSPVAGSGKIVYSIESVKQSVNVFRVGIQILSLHEQASLPYILERLKEENTPKQ